jgi:hypothetical protein
MNLEVRAPVAAAWPPDEDASGTENEEKQRTDAVNDAACVAAEQAIVQLGDPIDRGCGMQRRGALRLAKETACRWIEIGRDVAVEGLSARRREIEDPGLPRSLEIGRLLRV